MNVNELVTIIAAIVSALNAGFLAWLAFKKLKPELKKSEAEAEIEAIEASNLSLEGSKTSVQLLLDRVNEQKSEMDAMKKNHKEEMERLENSCKEEIARLEKLRSEDAEYFKRRIKDLDKEARDYRSWAAKLVKQVVEAGKVPVAFLPSFGESDAHITAIRTELEENKEDGK
jgi:hypothetical protein